MFQIERWHQNHWTSSNKKYKKMKCDMRNAKCKTKIINVTHNMEFRILCVLISRFSIEAKRLHTLYVLKLRATITYLIYQATSQAISQATSQTTSQTTSKKTSQALSQVKGGKTKIKKKNTTSFKKTFTRMEV